LGKRRTQHKQQRDTNTRAQRDTEQENKQLKREVARLRKQLEQADTPIEIVEEAKPTTLKCPSCKSPQISSITTPSGKVRHVCRSCNWRGVI